MEVIIQPDAYAAAELTARLIATAMRGSPKLVLGLATGRTMLRVYSILVEMHRKGEIDFRTASTFNLDEYVGVPPDKPGSYRHYMDKYLFSKVNIDPKNTYLPDGMAKDISAECERYEKAIVDCGGIDFQLLGIGRSGHIGFNEPLSAMKSRTREKALTPETIVQNSPFFGGPNKTPRRAITMGVGTILDARRCVLLATGAEKAAIIAKAVEGPITAMISATALQLHARCTVIIDKPAAAKLKHQDYYRWIFENEPEWQEFQKK